MYITTGTASQSTGNLSTVPYLGFYKGAGQTAINKMPALNLWLNAKPEFMLDFFPSGNWSTFVSSGNWSSSTWAAYGQATPVFSIPLTVWSNTLAEVAAGVADTYFQNVGNYMISKGFGSITLRPGWEYNIGAFPWAAVGKAADYVAAFRHFVDVFRALAGANFKFDWCSVCGYGQLDAETCYPGDSYVDIIGIDVYNQTWISNPTPATRWNDILTNGGRGLDWHKAFAAAHGKLVSFPEWGTGTREDGHGGGDDPLYMSNMIAWINDAITAQTLAYHGYWDYPAHDFDGEISDGGQPNSELVFLAEYGG